MNQRKNLETAVSISLPPPSFSEHEARTGGISLVTDSFVLSKFDELPDWLRDNKYILSGYRLQFSLRLCFASILRLHNETVNIWSHLLGAILFALLECRTLAYLAAAGGSSADAAIFTVYIASAVVCFTNSWVFHTFGCHSRKVQSTLVGLDFAGIFILIAGSFYPPIYYGFACNPAWRNVYLMAVSVLAFLGITGPCFEFYHRNSFRFVRVSIFAGVALSGVVPIIHGSLGTYTYVAISRLLFMYFLYACGVVCYVTRMPECFLPGYFDIWGSSHQLMHIFVCLGAIQQYLTCVHVFEVRSSMPCPPAV